MSTPASVGNHRFTRCWSSSQIPSRSRRRAVSRPFTGPEPVRRGPVRAHLWLRRGDQAPGTLPVALSAVSVLVLAISGWLGGELVYVHRMGVADATARSRMSAEERAAGAESGRAATSRGGRASNRTA